jgi:uncharacterized iron-regulated protein
MTSAASLLLVLVASIVGFASVTQGADRHCMWVDVYTGEPVPYEEVLEDLAEVDLVYIGESHSIERHHALQAQVLIEITHGQLRAINRPIADYLHVTSLKDEPGA